MRFKKIIYLTAFIFILFSGSAYAKDSFSSKNVYDTAKLLSSEKYRGRLAGDRGNALAAEYIAQTFKRLGLKPAGDKNTYFQKFEVVVPLPKGDCCFKVYDTDGNLVKEYKYGSDFKELTFGASIGGTVEGRIKWDDNSDGNIAVVEGGINESKSQYEKDMSLKKSGIKAAIYPTNMDFHFRSPYKLQAPYSEGIVKIMVSKKVMEEIMDYSGLDYRFEIKSPVEVKKVSVNNIIAKLDGKDKTLPPIILCAHFDHVGWDADGTFYPGAFDNASGTAFLLECARLLKSSGENGRTIIFAAFNGEEEGLVGSEYFVKHPIVDLRNAECINFDMIGSRENIPLSILSLESEAKFSSEVLKIASANTRANVLYEGDSDHASFCNRGIKAVTLIHDDVTKIHTPNDTIKNVDESKIDEVFKTVNSFLKSRNVVMVASKPYGESKEEYKIILFVIGILLILSSYILYTKKKTSKKAAG